MFFRSLISAIVFIFPWGLILVIVLMSPWAVIFYNHLHADVIVIDPWRSEYCRESASSKCVKFENGLCLKKIHYRECIVPRSGLDECLNFIRKSGCKQMDPLKYRNRGSSNIQTLPSNKILYRDTIGNILNEERIYVCEHKNRRRMPRQEMSIDEEFAESMVCDVLDASYLEGEDEVQDGNSMADVISEFKSKTNMRDDLIKNQASPRGEIFKGEVQECINDSNYCLNCCSSDGGVPEWVKTSIKIGLGLASGGLEYAGMETAAVIAGGATSVDLDFLSCGESDALCREKKGNKLCVYVGKKKYKTITDFEFEYDKEVYCCYKNLLAVALHRYASLYGIKSVGEATAPNCRGLYPSELQRIDFKKVDFRDFHKEVYESAKSKFPSFDKKDFSTIEKRISGSIKRLPGNSRDDQKKAFAKVGGNSAGFVKVGGDR